MLFQLMLTKILKRELRDQLINPRTYAQIHTPTVVQVGSGGG